MVRVRVEDIVGVGERGWTMSSGGEVVGLLDMVGDGSGGGGERL